MTVTNNAYEKDGKTYDRVSKIINQIQYLPLQWPANMAVDYMLENIDFTHTSSNTYERDPDTDHIYLSPMPYVEFSGKMSEARVAYKTYTDSEREIGQIVHANIADTWSGKYTTDLPVIPEDDEIRNAIKGFYQFQGMYKPRPIFWEQPLYSEKKMIAGTPDLYADLWLPGKRRPGKFIIDFKVSPRIYPQSILQLAAYDYMLREAYSGHHKCDGAAIVRLDKEQPKHQVKFYSRADLCKATTRFMLLLKYYRLSRKKK